MASVTKEWIGTNTWVSCRLVVSSTPNTDGNYSTVTATLYGARNDGGTSYDDTSSNFWININGTKTTRTSACRVSGNSWTKVHSQTTKVYHKDDGTKTITVSAGGGISDTSFQMGSASVTLVLDKIARKSTLEIQNGVLGNSVTLEVSRQSTAFTHTITYACGDHAGVVAEKSSDTTLSFTAPLEFADSNVEGSTVVITYNITTYSGESSIGSNAYSVIYDIPDSIVPSVEFDVSDAAGYASTYGYIQGSSKVNVSISASGVYGSAIMSYSTFVDDKYYNTSDFVTEPIIGFGEMDVIVTVTDSRGRKSTSTKTINVSAYTSPIISSMVVKRCDSDGTSSSSGRYIGVTFSGCVTSLDGKNSASYQLQYKKTSDTDYTTITITELDGEYVVTDKTYLFESDPSSSYELILVTTDSFYSATMQRTCSSVSKVFSIFRKGLGIALGKVAELEGFFDVNMDTVFRKTVQFDGQVTGAIHTLDNMILVPESSDLNDYITPGCYRIPDDSTASSLSNIPYEKSGRLIVCFLGNDIIEQRLIPDEYCNADVQTYIRVISGGIAGSWTTEGLKAYPIGSYYISNNDTSPAELFGGTWERIEGRFLWGCSEDDTIGEVGGESEHTLTTDEMPKHRHAVQCTKDEASGYGISTSSGFTNRVLVTGATAKSTGTTYYSGSGAAHNNMPPYINVVIWRRTA